MRLTDQEKADWLAAKSPKERRAVISRVKERERWERFEDRMGDVIEDSLRRFLRERP